jgi:hypothetical protein
MFAVPEPLLLPVSESLSLLLALTVLPVKPGGHRGPPAGQLVTVAHKCWHDPTFWGMPICLAKVQTRDSRLLNLVSVNLLLQAKVLSGLKLVGWSSGG